MKQALRVLIAVALVVGVVAPATADIFTVTLTNGSSFQTRYRPVQSASNEEKLQFLTDTGNWISLEKSFVVGIASETESQGFGTRIDTQTVALGWDPTSLAAAQEESETGEDPTMQLLNYLIEQDRAGSSTPAPPPFSNQQFVEPNAAGGIPMWMSNQTTPPIGGSGNQ